MASTDGRLANQYAGRDRRGEFCDLRRFVSRRRKPHAVAAQVVSGIGFLGAGTIFREGLHVTGLNTAATLWCSAAVGLLAGSGPSAACGAGDKFCRSRQSDVAASGL